MNRYCRLTRSQVAALNVPPKVQGLLMSPFVTVNGMVWVPEDTFQMFTDLAVDQIQIMSDCNAGKKL